MRTAPANGVSEVNPTSQEDGGNRVYLGEERQLAQQHDQACTQRGRGTSHDCHSHSHCCVSDAAVSVSVDALRVHVAQMHHVVHAEAVRPPQGELVPSCVHGMALRTRCK